MSKHLYTTPVFTLEQIEWLEKAFPENVSTAATSEELFINLGSRRVVKRIASIWEDNKRNAIK